MLEIVPIMGSKQRAAWNALWRVYDNDGTEAQRRDLWARLNDADLPYPVYGVLVLSGQKVVGFAHYQLYGTTASRKPVCYIQDLFVAETARRKGVARFVLNWFKAQLKEHGWWRVHLKTRRDNLAAQALYDRECLGRDEAVHYIVARAG